MEKERKIILNRAKCLKCGDILCSYYNWDFKTCTCGAISVDGGINELKRRGNPEDCEEMNVFDDASFEVIRKSLFRYDRGKNGDKVPVLVSLSEMSDNWIRNLMKYNTVRHVHNRWDLFGQAELLYRAARGITIKDEEEIKKSKSKISRWLNKQLKWPLINK